MREGSEIVSKQAESKVTSETLADEVLDKATSDNLKIITDELKCGDVENEENKILEVIEAMSKSLSSGAVRIKNLVSSKSKSLLITTGLSLTILCMGSFVYGASGNEMPRWVIEPMKKIVMEAPIDPIIKMGIYEAHHRVEEGDIGGAIEAIVSSYYRELPSGTEGRINIDNVAERGETIGHKNYDITTYNLRTIAGFESTEEDLKAQTELRENMIDDELIKIYKFKSGASLDIIDWQGMKQLPADKNAVFLTTSDYLTTQTANLKTGGIQPLEPSGWYDRQSFFVLKDGELSLTKVSEMAFNSENKVGGMLLWTIPDIKGFDLQKYNPYGSEDGTSDLLFFTSEYVKHPGESKIIMFATTKEGETAMIVSHPRLIYGKSYSNVLANVFDKEGILTTNVALPDVNIVLGLSTLCGENDSCTNIKGDTREQIIDEVEKNNGTKYITEQALFLIF